MRKFFYLTLIFMLMSSSLAKAAENDFIDTGSNVIEENETMKNSQEPAPKEAHWWENDIITATGYGFPKKNAENMGQRKVLARRAAIMDGYRRLAEQAAGIHITTEKIMVKGEIDALITGAQITSEVYDEYGNCKVELSVPLYGVVNSVSKAAFKPVSKETFLTPSVTDSENTLEGNYTGLIIDCSDLDNSSEDQELTAVLSPTIRSTDNQSIYSYNNLDYDKVISKGMISYAESMNGNVSRAGSNPLIIKAAELDNKNSTPVLSKIDTNKILMENQSSHFLDNCAVVFVSTRGIRDSYNRRGSSQKNYHDDGVV